MLKNSKFESGDHCLTELALLPKEARILATGNNLQEIQQDSHFFSEVSLINGLESIILKWFTL